MDKNLQFGRRVTAGGAPHRRAVHKTSTTSTDGAVRRQDPSTKLQIFIHPTALIDPSAKIGHGTKVWAFAQIRENAVIGRNCVIGNGVYIDAGVRIGNRVNIHNKALLYRNLTIEDDCFIGPGVCFVNDPNPRANRIRNLKGLKVTVKKGASIGANASVLSEVTIGAYAMVGAGSLVSKDVPSRALVYGVPAKVMGKVSKSGTQ